MDKNTVIIVILAVLVIVAVVQAFQIANIGDSATGNVVKGTASGSIDMTGWTENEKMNYEMHGIIPARFGGSSGAAGGMVGGC